MFLTRQKILTVYLYLLWKKCSRLHIIKMLFLFCKETESDIYDFHPYLRWPFSELIYLDLRKLDEKWIIKNGEFSVELLDIEKIKDVLKSLPTEYIYQLQNIINKYWKFTDIELMNFVYKIYPYFAINNPQKKWLFSHFDPREEKQNQIPMLFTIWYEGISLDVYIDKLIKNNITLLLDVRKNPMSMKYGFSKSRLKDVIEKRWMKYIHIPELWINWEERKDLKVYNDYLKLFELYRDSLSQKEKYLIQIVDFLNNGERVALTCFEADCNCCHRNEITKYIYPRISNIYELKHI